MKDVQKQKDDAFFDEMQRIWDSHSRRVDEIVRRSGSDRPRPNYAYADRKHRRETWGYAILTLCMVIASVYWACILWRYATDTAMLILTLLVEAFFVLMALHGLSLTLGRWIAPFGRFKTTTLPRLHVLQLAYITLPVMLMLPITSHGQTGDGLTIKQNHAFVLDHTQRVAAIQTIDKILNG